MPKFQLWFAEFSPCNSILAIQSLQFSPCNSVLAIQSLQFSPCNSVLAIQFLQFSPCNSVLAIQSLQFSPCNSVLAIQSLQFSHCYAVLAMQLSACNSDDPYHSDDVLLLLLGIHNNKHCIVRDAHYYNYNNHCTKLHQ